MSSVPFTLTTDPTTGNIIAGFGGIAIGGNTIADWPNGALCSTYPPGGAGWPPGPASDGPATNGAVILDFLNAMLWDGQAQPSIDIAGRVAYDGSGLPSVDFGNRLLNNGSGPSLDFGDRLLLDDSGDTTMDWNSQAAARLSGAPIRDFCRLYGRCQ